jgi:hypothetical protein
MGGGNDSVMRTGVWRVQLGVVLGHWFLGSRWTNRITPPGGGGGGGGGRRLLRFDMVPGERHVYLKLFNPLVVLGFGDVRP